MPEYLRADALLRPNHEDDFGGSIPVKAVTRLLELGVLQGRTVRGKQMVLADDALRRVLELGIEPYAFNMQGWSFAAVDAPIDRVAEVMRQVLDVTEIRERVKIHRMNETQGAVPPDGVRPLFLVKMRASSWTLLVIRLHWFAPSDWDLAELVAREASKRLKTRAVAAAGNDVSLPAAQEWRNGKSVEEWSGEVDDDFYVRFYEREIAAPACWIGSIDGKHAFMSDHAAAIERVDFIGIAEGGKKQPAPKKKTTLTFGSGMTGEDALRQLMDTIGVPTQKKQAKKRKAK